MTEVSPADSPVEEEAGEFVESGEDEPSFPRPLPLALHDIVVVDSAGQIDFEYRVVSFQPTSPEASAQPIIVVVSVEGKFLVAVPGVSWSKAVRDRRLPSQSLTKVFSAQVLASSEDSRDQPSDGVYIKVWFGLLKPEFEQCLDLSGAGIPHPAFPTVQSEEGFLPFAQSLVTVADEKYSFFSADSGPPVPSSQKRNPVELESRVLNIEASIQEIASSLQVLMSGGQPSVSSPSKPAHVPRPPALRTQKFPGLDQGVVNAALQSGIDSSQLAQLSQMLGGRKPHLKDVPPEKQKPRVTFDILGEPVTPEPEESGVADSLQPARNASGPGQCSLSEADLHCRFLGKQEEECVPIVGTFRRLSSVGGTQCLLIHRWKPEACLDPFLTSPSSSRKPRRHQCSDRKSHGKRCWISSQCSWDWKPLGQFSWLGRAQVPPSEHQHHCFESCGRYVGRWIVSGPGGSRKPELVCACLWLSWTSLQSIEVNGCSRQKGLWRMLLPLPVSASTASRMHWNPSTRSFGPLPGRRL